MNKVSKKKPNLSLTSFFKGGSENKNDKKKSKHLLPIFNNYTTWFILFISIVWVSISEIWSYPLITGIINQLKGKNNEKTKCAKVIKRFFTRLEINEKIDMDDLFDVAKPYKRVLDKVLKYKKYKFVPDEQSSISFIHLNKETVNLVSLLDDEETNMDSTTTNMSNRDNNKNKYNLDDLIDKQNEIFLNAYTQFNEVNRKNLDEIEFFKQRSINLYDLNNNMITQIEDLNNVLEVTKKKLNERQQELGQTKEELQNKEKELQNKEIENEKLKIRETELNEELKGINTKITQLEEYLEKSNNLNKEIHKENQALRNNTRKTLKEKQQELEVTKKELQQTQKELEVTKKKLKEKQQELERTQFELEVKKQKLEQTEKELEKTKTELVEKEKKLVDITKQLKGKDNELTNTKKQLEDITKELVLYENYNEELEKNNEELEQNNEELEKNNNELNKNNNELNKNNEELEKKNEELKKNNKILKNNNKILNDYKEKLKEVKNENKELINELENEIEKLEIAIEGFRTIVDVLIKEIKDLQKANKGFITIVDVLIKKIINKENENIELNKNLQKLLVVYEKKKKKINDLKNKLIIICDNNVDIQEGSNNKLIQFLNDELVKIENIKEKKDLDLDIISDHQINMLNYIISSNDNNIDKCKLLIEYYEKYLINKDIKTEVEKMIEEFKNQIIENKNKGGGSSTSLSRRSSNDLNNLKQFIENDEWYINNIEALILHKLPHKTIYQLTILRNDYWASFNDVDDDNKKKFEYIKKIDSYIRTIEKNRDFYYLYRNEIYTSNPGIKRIINEKMQALWDNRSEDEGIFDFINKYTELLKESTFKYENISFRIKLDKSIINNELGDKEETKKNICGLLKNSIMIDFIKFRDEKKSPLPLNEIFVITDEFINTPNVFKGMCGINLKNVKVEFNEHDETQIDVTFDINYRPKNERSDFELGLNEVYMHVNIFKFIDLFNSDPVNIIKINSNLKADYVCPFINNSRLIDISTESRNKIINKFKAILNPLNNEIIFFKFFKAMNSISMGRYNINDRNIIKFTDVVNIIEQVLNLLEPNLIRNKKDKNLFLSIIYDNNLIYRCKEAFIKDNNDLKNQIKDEFISKIQKIDDDTLYQYLSMNDNDLLIIHLIYLSSKSKYIDDLCLLDELSLHLERPTEELAPYV